MVTLIFIGITLLIGIIVTIVRKDISIIVASFVIIFITILISLIIGAVIDKNIAPDILVEEETIDIASLDLKDEYYLGVENKKELYWFLTKKDNNITGLKSVPISKSVINNSDENKKAYVLIYYKTHSDNLKRFFPFNLHDDQEYIFYIPKNTVYYNFETN